MATPTVHLGRRAVPWWYGLLAAFLTLPPLLGACCWGLWYSAANTVTVWEIPADFRGYAVLEWENPACPDLPRRGLMRVVPIDAAGYACTANRPGDVPGSISTVLVWPDGRREELRSQDYTYDGLQAYFGFTAYPGDGSHRYDAQFIGTASEYRAIAATPRPAICATPGRIASACVR